MHFRVAPAVGGFGFVLSAVGLGFRANEALFRGLAIHDRWDWSARHPVLRLSFGSGHFQAPNDLRVEVDDRLRRHLDEPIHLVAVECSREAHNLAAFEVERA